MAPPYYDDPVYIDALAASLQGALAGLNFKPDVILASFHGMPEEYVEKGDPYRFHCEETARLLREKLGMSAEQQTKLFQRF